jgi:hypothetical protein
MTNLLAGLQVRKELGDLPPRPQDTIGQTEWIGSVRRTNQTFSGIPREGKRPCAPEHQAAQRTRARGGDLPSMVTAERQNVSKPVDPEILSRLCSEVLSTALELGPSERVQVLYSMWPRQPHGELKSIVVSLAESRRKEHSFYLDEGYKFWCEGRPQECSSAILSDAIPCSSFRRTALCQVPTRSR